MNDKGDPRCHGHQGIRTRHDDELKRCTASDERTKRRVGRRIRLRPHSLAPRPARHLVREQTRPLLDRQLAEKCALVAGALITSAIRRTNDVVEFSLDISDGTVTLRARESYQLSWLAVGADPWERCRHGQQITGRLAQSWGYERAETGGQLWASLRGPEPPSRPAVAV